MKTALPLVVLLVLLSACSKDAPSTPPADIRSVRAEQVGLHGAQGSTRYSGEVRARYETDLAFRVTGRVQTRAVEAGTLVKSGQLIATLDPADYALASTAAQAQRVAAEAEARLAQQDLQRYTALRAQNFISQAELDRRESVSQAAQARARELRAEASRQGNQQAYTRLTAPYAGVVTATRVEAGQVVAAGQPVASLARTGEREVRIDVPENALDDLRAARTLKVRLWSAPDATYVGRLREVSPMADATSRTFSARVSIADADAAVKLGMTATVEVDSESAPSLSVAQSALFKVDGQPQVWVVEQKSGKVAARSVQLGALAGERVAIVSGVAAGEWVVTAGVHKLAPGQQVRVLTPAQP
ncbi:MAG: efflux transporter periplasmic adaptor subunit [Hydrogenophilales bacterium 12-61-10]|nr:MAG: efflux transporter periplasmic adaptor subunit [Hydrogenophilales bacterium 12-61-10]OYX28667.1 MAG: efflux transporter periplasmic adaptor subunit [Hydrogenophilales bacterium 32-62-9]